MIMVAILLTIFSFTVGIAMATDHIVQALSPLRENEAETPPR